MKRRTIGVVTGTRADYGLLYWLMKELQSDQDLNLQVIATGMHLSPEFGLTYRVIEEDGFTIAASVEMLLSSDTAVGIAKSIGLGVIGFADALDRLRPDILVLLGDRYEILAAAQAALTARIPIAHLHGGEVTEGAIDDGMRHAITKMAHLHFVAAEPYRRRVIQLGEQPDTVFTVGAPGLDAVTRLKLLERKELENEAGFALGPINFLVTYHPATLGAATPGQAMQALLDALDYFPEAHIIFTRPNADTAGRVISSMIDDYVECHKDRTAVFTSLGQLRYLSAVKLVDVVIGNSSSGIIEAPAFKTPTVNIGERQTGRLKAASVLNCNEETVAIVAAIRTALSREFRETLPGVVPPYGMGEASVKIKENLKAVNLDGITRKRFYDL